MTCEGIRKQAEELCWHINFSPTTVGALVDSMILQLWKLKHRNQDSYTVVEVKDLIIDEKILAELTTFMSGEKITLKEVKTFLTQMNLRLCPICMKWTKELHEQVVDISTAWQNIYLKENKELETKKVCGFCHDFIADQLPPTPGDDDFDRWIAANPEP